MKLRRTMLYVPGNNSAMVKDAQIYRSDSILFDLEDSVSLKEKDAARFLVFNALHTLFYGSIEKVVRINALDGPFGMEDVKAMVAAGVDAIRLPKAECADDIRRLDKAVAEAERRYGMREGSTKLMAAIESAAGVLNAKEIAMASPRLVAIAIGAEDFVTDLHTSRSREGTEIFVARSIVVMAARAAGIMAIDTIFPDVADEQGFENEVRLAKQLGFDGKSVIHPLQIPIVNSVYAPTKEEVQKALRVVAAMQEAEAKGSGAIALDGRMLDKPILERALRNLELARAAGVEIPQEAEV
jgi:citrate lyase subunit beta / citryl-CoA lyase